MRKIIWAFLLCLVVMPSRAATLQGVGDIERCWKVPNYSIFDGSLWAANCGGTVVSGDYLCAQEGGVFGDVAETLTPATAETEVHCWCRMTSPYVGYYVYSRNYTESYGIGERALSKCGEGYGAGCRERCRYIWIGKYCEEKGYDSDCVADGYEGFFPMIQNKNCI